MYWHTAVQVNRDLEKEVRRVGVQTESRISRVLFKEASVQTEGHETGKELGKEVWFMRGQGTVRDVREGIPRKTECFRWKAESSYTETHLALGAAHLTLEASNGIIRSVVMVKASSLKAYSLVDSSQVSTFLISILLIVYGSFRSLNMDFENQDKEKDPSSSAGPFNGNSTNN
ncbi:hypothetical protein JRQ81_008028, partial [Phrynocephalus forsythii]